MKIFSRHRKTLRLHFPDSGFYVISPNSHVVAQVSIESEFDNVEFRVFLISSITTELYDGIKKLNATALQTRFMAKISPHL